MEKFGWFYKVHNALPTSWADGDLSTHSGKSDFSLLGQIDTWNYRKTTDAYTGECGKVQGSADGLFAPGVFGREKELRIFSTDICRFVFQQVVFSSNNMFFDISQAFDIL